MSTGADPAVQHLLSLPPAMARDFARVEQKQPPEWLTACDPAGLKLGSAGGVAHLLCESWRQTPGAGTFDAWLKASQKLLLLAGGQSRRLPAYAAVGKVLMPMPVLRWAVGQRLNQSLLDLQLPAYRRLFAHAPQSYRAMVTSGDVLLQFARALPDLPEADVLILGMWVRPDVATGFGVLFQQRGAGSDLAFFLQKPESARIHDLSRDHLFMVDTGIWLLSVRATQLLMKRCGWDAEASAFRGGTPTPYEMYADFGLGLGSNPTRRDPEVNALTAAVVSLPEAEFHHLGTSRQMIGSATRLQNQQLDQTKLGETAVTRQPDQHILSSEFKAARNFDALHTLWVENSVIPSGWRLSHSHVLTGVPANSWSIDLAPGICLDFTPIGTDGFAFRPYGIDDTFRGAVGEATTHWMGRPATQWFAARHIPLDEAGVAPATDIQEAGLFPVLPAQEIDEALVRWMLAEDPAGCADCRERWLSAPRLSAMEICEQADLGRLYGSRRRLMQEGVRQLAAKPRSLLHQLDLLHTASLLDGSSLDIPRLRPGDGAPVVNLARDCMFHAVLRRRRGDSTHEQLEREAFGTLRDAIMQEASRHRVTPKCDVLEDQIIWGRSPVRIDLAGGWSDTPPYCLQYGGTVLNLAVDINGHPPVQVFVRVCEQPIIVIRSIDLGVSQTIRTYEELESYADFGSGFALAKAALALAGFLPAFHRDNGFASLEEQLRDFGGGLEISLLAAIPKGSGLGTSSILAATLLGTLGEVCGLNWDKMDLFNRTLVLEQMLTTGGGWQDQAGGLFRGIKLVSTRPGIIQQPALRYLPEHLFTGDYANRRVLLYYTGITRLAKNILAEIVRGIFLNSASHLAVLDEFAPHAEATFNAILSGDWDGLSAAVARSWTLNSQLDLGTNPEPVQAIIERISDYVAGLKLAGAGGGGYMIIFAKDDGAAQRIRADLENNPPNRGARFVDFSISETGLNITRS